MPRFYILILTIVLTLLPARLLLPQDSPPNASESIHGVWVAEKVLSAGREVPKKKFPFEVHFTKDQLIFKFVGDTRGKDRVHGILFDASSEPATIDITRTLRDKKMTVYGIYKIENGRLLICSLRGPSGSPSSKRPTSFESSRDNKAELLILKRKPDGDK